AFAPAVATCCLHVPSAATVRTGDVEPHLPALVRYLAAAFAGAADLRRTDRAFAAAVVAHFQMRDSQLSDRAAHRFPEADADVIFQIGAGFGLLHSGFGAASAEELTEEITETGSRLAAKIEASEVEVHVRVCFRRDGAAPFGVKAELIVHLPL